MKEIPKMGILGVQTFAPRLPQEVIYIQLQTLSEAFSLPFFFTLYFQFFHIL